MLQPWQLPHIIEHSQLLINSYYYWTKQPLLGSIEEDAGTVAKKLYEAPFVLVSHNTEPDPVFNYANLRAQELWKLPWEKFTNMPSRLSAEPMEESRRRALIEDGRKRGVVQIKQGVRITNEGKRFLIKDVTLWNVMDEKGNYFGQAATYNNWEFI